MEKQISIIIPTYNMEKYIGRCLDSLLIPEIDQVEVLVVNDGSKDRSSEIAHSYAERYPDSIRVIDKANGNYGSCINAALPLCTGRYVKVLDADDTFDTQAFSRFVCSLTNIDSDVVITDMIVVDENNNESAKSNHSSKKCDFATNYTFDDIYNSGLLRGITMHSVAYNIRYFNTLTYHQTEHISFTDTEWVGIPIALATTFRILNIGNLYRYLVGRIGQTVDPNRFSSQINDYFLLIENKANTFQQHHLEKLRYEYFNIRTMAIIRLLYLKIIDSKNKELLLQLYKFDSNLIENHPELIQSTNNIIYYPHVNYKFIEAMRNAVDPKHFCIPRIVKLKKRVLNILGK